MRKVEVSITIKTTSERVIQAFTNPAMLGEWWGVEKALIEKKVGGLYTIAWQVTEKGMGYVSTGIIKKYDPNKILEIVDFVYLSHEKPFLGPMNLTIRAQEKNGITHLYLCQDGYQEGKDWNWYHEAVKEAWPKVMEQFKEYLEKTN
ncbi:MAG: SRPBCC domain-containing protein [Ignavibacteriae bacterium]|nr:SRPBCC domain-containing protein [Ignavibacteriota bacterium]